MDSTELKCVIRIAAIQTTLCIDAIQATLHTDNTKTCHTDSCHSGQHELKHVINIIIFQTKVQIGTIHIIQTTQYIDT